MQRQDHETQLSHLELLPVELLYTVATGLSIPEAKRLSLCSSTLFHTLGEKYFIRRPSELELNSISMIAAEFLFQYVTVDCSIPPGYEMDDKPKDDEFAVVVSYGEDYHRAHCFNDILRNTQLSADLKVFSLFVLLTEESDNELKNTLILKLKEVGGEAIIRNINEYLLCKFGGKLDAMTANLLVHIHKNSYDDYKYDDNYQLSYHEDFWERHLKQVAEDPVEIEKPAHSWCMVS